MPTTDTLALALGAGLVAAVNPCGFALLPAYLSLFVLDSQPSRTVAVLRAVKATTALTLGFAGVFALFGLVIAPVASAVQAYLPVFTVLLGLVVAAAGGWVLAGRKLPSITVGRRPHRTGAPTASFGSMAGFGASYAVASLGCTIAPFLAVVVTAFRADSALAGSLLFVTYAAGMGLTVGAAAIAVALARTGLIDRARAAGGWLPRLGGGLLLVAGAYVAWYGAWELRVLHGGAGADPIVSAAEHVQQWLAGLTETVGALGFAGIIAILVTGGLVLGRRSVRSAGSTTESATKEQSR